MRNSVWNDNEEKTDSTDVKGGRLSEEVFFLPNVGKPTVLPKNDEGYVYFPVRRGDGVQEAIRVVKVQKITVFILKTDINFVMRPSFGTT